MLVELVGRLGERAPNIGGTTERRHRQYLFRSSELLFLSPVAQHDAVSLCVMRLSMSYAQVGVISLGLSFKTFVGDPLSMDFPVISV